MKLTDELSTILEEHARWLASSASSGTRANLSGAKLDGVDLAGADLSGAILRGASLTGAVLRNAQLTHTNLCDASLENADLQGADLQLADFSGADLTGADLSHTTATPGKELGQVRRGPRFRDAVLRGVRLTESFCAMSDFKGSQLEDADFRGASLDGANLALTDLSGISLKGASLSRADLHGSTLVGTDLSECVLTAANLEGADLTDADVSGADLRGADLANARVERIRYDRGARFRGVRVATCYGSSRFRRFAQDQDYIEEFKESHRATYWLWRITTDCGRSLTRVALWSLGLTLSFAMIYFALGEESFEILNRSSLGWNLLTAFYYSMVAFTTLGFGDITPRTPLSAAIVIVEVLIGYVMLGILISILANKVARRS